MCFVRAIFFVRICHDAVLLTGVSKFQVRWPYGTSGARALSPVLDVYPDEAHARQLPFSAAEALGGSWFPVHYKECIQHSRDIVTYRGYRFMRLAKLLLWTSISGRSKDLAKVQTILPLAVKGGLLSAAEKERILLEFAKSAALREQYPSRYYARVPEDS